MEIPCLLEKVRTILPTNLQTDLSDDKLQALCEVVVADINYVTPETRFTLCSAPDHWQGAVIMGFQYFYTMSDLMLKYALKDMSYSDNGLSLNIDRTGKLNVVLQGLERAYNSMAWGIKKAHAFRQGPAGLGYPRYQAAVSNFLRIIFGRSLRM